MENLTHVKETMLVLQIQHSKVNVQPYNPPYFENRHGSKKGNINCLFFFFSFIWTYVGGFCLCVLGCTRLRVFAKQLAGLAETS